MRDGLPVKMPTGAVFVVDGREYAFCGNRGESPLLGDEVSAFGLPGNPGLIQRSANQALRPGVALARSLPTGCGRPGRQPQVARAGGLPNSGRIAR
jgi:hypothetical protein